MDELDKLGLPPVMIIGSAWLDGSNWLQNFWCGHIPRPQNDHGIGWSYLWMGTGQNRWNLEAVLLAEIRNGMPRVRRQFELIHWAVRIHSILWFFIDNWQRIEIEAQEIHPRSCRKHPLIMIFSTMF